MKVVLLSELLRPEQVNKIEEILRLEDSVRWKNLRKYLQSLRVQLESKGVLPEYLAYYIEYQQTKNKYHEN